MSPAITLAETSESAALSRRLRNQVVTVVMAFITTICIISTVFFAYNNTLDKPYVDSLVAKSPDKTILALNIMSQITLHSLSELTSLVMDTTRWALATGESGISALTFLALSQATSLVGALFLSFGTRWSKRPWAWGG
jgi:hypothetical protein